jgi:hypothetical protein
MIAHNQSSPSLGNDALWKCAISRAINSDSLPRTSACSDAVHQYQRNQRGQQSTRVIPAEEISEPGTYSTTSPLLKVANNRAQARVALSASKIWLGWLAQSFSTTTGTATDRRRNGDGHDLDLVCTIDKNVGIIAINTNDDLGQAIIGKVRSRLLVDQLANVHYASDK